MTQQQLLTIKLNIDSFNVLLRGLDQLPHGQSRPIVDDILAQAQAQVTPAHAPILDVEPAEERE